MLTAHPNPNHACAKSHQPAKCVLFLAALPQRVKKNPPSYLGARTRQRPRDPRDHDVAQAKPDSPAPPTIVQCATWARSDSCAPGRYQPQSARPERSNYFQPHWWPALRGESLRAQILRLVARHPSVHTAEEFQHHARPRDHATFAQHQESHARRAETQEHRLALRSSTLQSRRPPQLDQRDHPAQHQANEPPLETRAPARESRGNHQRPR